MNTIPAKDGMPSVPPASATIASLQVGLPRTLATEEAAGTQRTWTTGYFKTCVHSPVWLDSLNLVGDGQADLVHHGGANKALCAYPADHYPFWNRELSHLEMRPGAFGENLTISGLTENDVSIGDIWKVGETIIQVSQPRQPCWKLSRRWMIDELALLVQQTGRTGWYFRVLRKGFIAAGMPISLVERPFAEWTIASANHIMHHDKTNHREAARLASLPPLSSSWKESLTKRVQRNIQPDEQTRLRRKD